MKIYEGLSVWLVGEALGHAIDALAVGWLVLFTLFPVPLMPFKTMVTGVTICGQTIMECGKNYQPAFSDLNFKCCL